MLRRCVIVWAVAALLASASAVQADLFIDSANNEILDITATVGTGANTSYLIVDFAATGGDTYAFAYGWDDVLAPAEPLTSHDMLLEVAIETAFGASISSSAFGAFVNNFLYANDVGNPDNFWSFSLGDVIDPGVQWTSPAFGIDDRQLADGSLDGWYNGFTDDFDSIPPMIPTVQIPGPAGVMMFAAALLVGRPRRRK